MSDRLVNALAVGRIAVGTSLLAAPGPTGRPWIGADADRSGGRALLRGFGARDLAIGAGLLAAQRAGDPLRPWLVAGLVADAADAVATLAARDRLPKSAAGVLALAVTATVGNAILAAQRR